MRGHAWHARVRPLRTLRSGNRSRRIRVKRGNLYPEQRQIGMRVVSATQGGPPEHAGRRLEPRGNAWSRGMIAGQRKLAYRIRPIVHPALNSFLPCSGRAALRATARCRCASAGSRWCRCIARQEKTHIWWYASPREKEGGQGAFCVPEERRLHCLTDGRC